MNKLAIAAVGFAVLAGAAQAQPMRGAVPDLDRDGKVTLSEFKRGRADAMMARLDANRDGRLDRRELTAAGQRAGARDESQARGGRMAKMLPRLDADHDGALSRTEIEAGASRRFEAADANRDGWLSEGELSKMRRRGPRAG